ncbi:mucin-binding protein [Limosilactobacillus mucosae]|uniref:mucin-binding protein n=1 Tax=Limosilactobacillus mucosae TaxID=97478 RepID=UPI00233E6A40|nr:MucBP domain-containing protein [Limosilactobacillus mucosae]MDC2840548.1 MucBP domain-containing protein [Limosilactobacillus mucosae]
MMERCFSHQQHWGLRKLSIGVASVLLGTAIIAQGSAYADTQTKPADSSENSTDKTADNSMISGNTYVLKSSNVSSVDSGAPVNDGTSVASTSNAASASPTKSAGTDSSAVNGEDQDINGVPTTFTRAKSAVTGNSDNNQTSNESGEYWPDTKGTSIKNYGKTTSTDFSADKTVSENAVIDPSTIKGYDQEYSDTPNLMHTKDLHLYVNGKEVDISTLQDDDSLNNNSEYPNHSSKGHARLIKTSDFGPNTYFYARNAVQKYNQITGEIDHYDVKWTLESVNYANEQALLAFGIKGILDSGGNLLFNVGSGWQVAKRGNFANTHLQFFKEINADNFANQDGTLKETVADAIKNGDIAATALKIHEGFLDLDSDEAIEITESTVKHVLVDDSSTLAYQKTSDGYLAITRTYNDVSNHDLKFGNSDSVAVLLELDVPEEGFDLSIVTTGPSVKGEISGGSKVAPAVLDTAAYLKTLTVNYYALDENGNSTTTKLKDTKTARNFIGKSYGLQNTDQDRDGKQDAFDYSAPQEITDQDGTTWKLVETKTTGNNLKNHTYQDCLNVINYYYQKSKVSKQGTESVTYKFYSDQEKTKLVKEITKTPDQDGKWRIEETVYDDQGNETHQSTISLMEGLSADQATVKFTGTVNYDGNGKVTGTTWDANDRTYGTIKTPAVEGYTADKDSVGGETVLSNDSSLNRAYEVVYTQNRYSLTEKFVDEDGHELLSNVSKGSSYKNGDGFNVTKDAKVISGYVLIKQDNTKGKFGNGDQTATFIYKKVGKLVPVDENNTPIPGADTPSYKNDPDDPTKVVPNESTPEVPGYTPSTPRMTPEDPTKDTPVPYTQNQYGLTEKFVDEDGHEVSPSVSKGSSYKNGDDFDVTGDAKVINGYVLVKQDNTKGKFGNGDQTATFIYKKVGKLVPVDENNTPIPGADTPIYKNDPNDPTKVLNPTVPSIDGWKPKDNQPGDSITPNDPTQDTLVQYIQVVSGTIKYIDDTMSKELSSEPLAKGTVGSKIDYQTADKIKDYEDHGYELVSNNFSDGKQTYTKEGNDFVVHLKHATKETVSYKDATQTIHYTGVGSDTPADKIQTEKHAFSKTDTIDQVTGKVIKTTGWTGTKTFGTEDTPVVEGYHADKKTAGGLTATVDNPNVKETVNYAPNGKLIPVDPNGTPIPGTNMPTYKTNPNDPTKVLDPTVPSIDGWQPKEKQPGESITPTNPGKDTPVVYVKKRQKPVMPVIPEQPKNPAVPNNPEQQGTPNQADNSTQRATVSNSVTVERSVAADSEKETALPQTGNDNNQAKAAMGLGLTSISTIMAMFGLKKRRHN